jgi:hypothetical protein
MKLDDFLDLFPRGFIVGWYSDSNIPRGWALCDGTNHTPNLINKFPMGASHPNELRQSGGALDHTHQTGNGHTYADGYGHDGDRNGAVHVNGLSHYHDVNAATHLPPYQKIMFIMKT